MLIFLLKLKYKNFINVKMLKKCVKYKNTWKSNKFI